MAEETVSARPLEWRNLLRPAAVDQRYTAIALTVVVFAFVLTVYYITSVGPTPYHQPVRLADALLHGRTYVADGGQLSYMEWAPYHGKFYPVDPPMGALVLLPGVVIFGTDLNQTLVSVVIGAITVTVVFWLMRGLTPKLTAQLAFTTLFAFGTTFWWAAVGGHNWYYAHTVATLFLVLAIYETLIGKRPFSAGVFLGASYLSRLTPILAILFFIIMLSDQWLVPSARQSYVRRIDPKPLCLFGLGVGIFLLVSLAYNYSQFDTVLPASRHYYFEQFQPRPDVLKYGLWDPIHHFQRHFPHFFRSIAIFQSEAPYVLPSRAGVAFWVVTPPFLYALFAGIKNRLVVIVGAVVLAASLLSFIVMARGLGFEGEFDPPLGLEYVPFLLLIGTSVFSSARSGNKLVLACWSAIIPIALVHFTYFAPPPQFGYQYAIDYLPFLFLLVWATIGDNLKWHHIVLIAAAVVVNLWGVLWWWTFGSRDLWGLEWVKW